MQIFTIVLCFYLTTFSSNSVINKNISKKSEYLKHLINVRLNNEISLNFMNDLPVFAPRETQKTEEDEDDSEEYYEDKNENSYDMYDYYSTEKSNLNATESPNLKNLTHVSSLIPKSNLTMSVLDLKSLFEFVEHKLRPTSTTENTFESTRKFKNGESESILDYENYDYISDRYKFHF
jgi:hypothetical protein